MDTDLAWAAGFIDGEGCFFATVDNRGSVRTIISISQREREPLDYLQGLFGGSIAPVVNKGNPAFILTIAAKQQVLDAIEKVGPYLRCKGDQADTLREMVEHMLTHGGRGRYSTIDKEWCWMKVQTLKAQKRKT